MWQEVERALNESTARVLAGVARLLPGCLALLIAVVVAAGVAWLVSAALRRFLRSVEFDERLERLGLAGVSHWSPGRSPTALVSRVTGWLIVLVGFLIGIAAFDATLPSQLAIRLFEYLPNVVVAAVLFVVGHLLARYLARGVLISAVNQNLQYARLLSVGVKWLVLVLAATMALEHLGIGGRIVSVAFAVLFGGIVLTLALAVGLGSKDLVTRSIERQATKAAEEPVEPLRHL